MRGHIRTRERIRLARTRPDPPGLLASHRLLAFLTALSPLTACSPLPVTRRALSEASDLNDFFQAPGEMQSRLLVRTASFCTERSGHFDEFDQGICFYLPNQTWLQPPAHVHAMVAASKRPLARNVTIKAASKDDPLASRGGGGSGFSVSAQSSADGTTSHVVRFVNPFASPIGPGG